MPWTPSHIDWNQQIMLMEILLPPIFIAFGFLAFAAPLFFRAKTIRPAPAKSVTAERILVKAR